MPKRLFIFGFGYSARAIAKRLLADGWQITGTIRTEADSVALRDMGVEPFLLGTDDLLAALKDTTHLLMCAAPTAEGDPLLSQLGALPQVDLANLTSIGYLSTTGVYGDHGGEWIDETTKTNPATERGRQRVEAENAWEKFTQTHNVPLCIFRLAGIYGPGRGPFSKLKSGTARRIVKPGQVFSRIHVDDIALTIQAALNRPQSAGIFNLCDNAPAPPQDILEYAARLLGVPVPPHEDFDTAEMSPMARSFYSESKKVRNDKIKDVLGVTLRYPDYQTGLAAMLRFEETN